MWVGVWFFAVVAAMLTACGVGVSYAFGVALTAAKVTVLLCSGAGVGGLLSSVRVIAGHEFGHEETKSAINGIASLAVALVIICGVALR